jgi:hypothetical protein
MTRDFKKVFLLVGAAAVSALLLFFWQPSSAEPAAVAEPPRATPSPEAAILQTYRNLGKAYYEQGKYSPASEQF